jgi:tRNA A37 threonylcarbamoyladenosine biosynthesis protein TsaE
MGGGIDFTISDLIAKWRLDNPNSTQKDLFEFLFRYFSTHQCQVVEWPEYIQEKPLTKYFITDNKRKHVDSKCIVK